MDLIYFEKVLFIIFFIQDKILLYNNMWRLELSYYLSTYTCGMIITSRVRGGDLIVGERVFKS